jgi:mono/diheme cytochrome c family protein
MPMKTRFQVQSLLPRLGAGSFTHVIACMLAGLSMLTLAGCRGERTDDPPRQFIPDMDDGPKFKPQSESEFFSDGRTMRPVVPNAVAFGYTPRPESSDRARFLRESPEQYQGIDTSKPTGKDGVVSYVNYMPASVIDSFVAYRGERGQTLPRDQALAALIQRGQERFNIYCSACHGYNGEGGNPASQTGGTVGQRWGYPVPSFHDAKYTDRQVSTGLDGYLFHVIRNGIADADPAKPNKMPAYRDKINVQDAWAIVAYLRVLQASWIQDPAKVPAELREKLPPMPAPLKFSASGEPGVADTELASTRKETR